MGISVQQVTMAAKSRSTIMSRPYITTTIGFIQYRVDATHLFFPTPKKIEAPGLIGASCSLMVFVG